MHSMPRPATQYAAPRPAPVAGPRVAATPYGTQAARYREAELASASPGQLVVMLYDKMLLTLRRARVATEARDIEGRVTHLLSVHDMVTELKVSLDHEVGGTISRDLDALYAFMLQELMAANRHADVARIDVVLRIAGELREAFAGAQAQLAAGAPAAARIA